MRRVLLALIACGAVACAAVACEEPGVVPVDGGAPDAGADVAPDVADEPDAGPEDSGGPALVWVSTADALWRFNPSEKTLERVATVSCAAEQLQDLAVDRAGRLWASTLESLVRIDPTTGECTRIAKGAYPRSLAFAPPGVLDVGEVLVGFVQGQYQRIDTKTGAVTFAGALYPNAIGFPLEASGDLVVLPTGKAYLVALSPNPAINDVLVQVDLATGQATRFVAPTNHPSLAGLGAQAGWLYAFAASGKVYRIAPNNGGTTEVMYMGGDASAFDGGSIGLAFTGAAVASDAP